jgi:hypothetical protein
MENPSVGIKNGLKPFNPDNVPGCINALGSHKEINIQNLVTANSDNLLGNDLN